MRPLTGDGTRLREVRTEDLEDYLAIVGDDRVTSWLSFDSRDREAARTSLTSIVERSAHENRSDYLLAVTRRDDDRMIGFARLGPTGVQAAHLGYAIGYDYWGHGYATDASRTLLRFAFTDLSLHRVSAAIGPENLASIAVVKNLGFSYEGRIRHHVFTNNAWRDSLLYSILAPEWSGA
ncbi:ribosomal-protein-alanine N-acetyltransferase [Kribbella sp. VKM Ac-2527]|uniref:Ribosomal-protein-alanine N-acetyltransferase n=1 Tax=Kribbella caucasensis TaxID=2512215 RepID=A0A4R6KQZ5_9ACTN|nr:GNAT family protein [Kribbella sp. VKM Ac-2527]TDO54991.1 ribosomal-protein-alanine N-acetyltransferase [Kribbella sp. VKM Ac-2527]